MTEFNRRTLLAAAAAAAAAPTLAAAQARPALLTRPIPSSGERIPVVGIGTSQVFDYADDPAKHAERKAVVQAFVAGGGTLIDTAPSYGRAEERLGEVMAETGLRPKIFLATKIRASADRATQIAEMETSKRRLKTDRFDLMQAHNVGNPSYDLGLLREWKSAKIIRYTGITTSNDGAYEAIEQVLRREKPDFFQVDYAIDNLGADARLLPAARDAGAAVLVNGPFGRNRLFAKVANRPLPDFAKDIGAATWAQFFLKFLISHPAITAVIPGTDKVSYVQDNLAAGRGPMPDAAMRKRMADYIAALPAA